MSTDWRGIAMAFAQLKELAEPNKIELMEKEYELRAIEQEKQRAFRAAETEFGILKESYDQVSRDIDYRTENIEDMNAGALNLANQGEEFITPAFHEVIEGIDLTNVKDLRYARDKISHQADSNIQYLSEITNIGANMKYGRSLRESMGGADYNTLYTDADGNLNDSSGNPYTKENTDINSMNYVEGVKPSSWDFDKDGTYTYDEYEKGFAQILNLELEATRDADGNVHPDQIKGIAEGFWSGEKGSEGYITQKAEDDRYTMQQRKDQKERELREKVNDLIFKAEWRKYAKPLEDEGYITINKSDNSFTIDVSEDLIVKKIEELQDKEAQEKEDKKKKPLSGVAKDFDIDKSGDLDEEEKSNLTLHLAQEKEAKKDRATLVDYMKRYGDVRYKYLYNALVDPNTQRVIYAPTGQLNTEGDTVADDNAWRVGPEEFGTLQKDYNKMSAFLQNYGEDDVLGGRDGSTIVSILADNAKMIDAYSTFDVDWWDQFGIRQSKLISDKSNLPFGHGRYGHESPFTVFPTKQNAFDQVEFDSEVVNWAEEYGFSYVLEGFDKEFETKLKNFQFKLGGTDQEQLINTIAASDTFNYIINNWDDYVSGRMDSRNMKGGFLSDENRDGKIDSDDFTELIYRFKSRFPDHFGTDVSNLPSFRYKISKSASNEGYSPTR